SSASSSLTKMRSAWNVRVAGWIAPGRACTIPVMMSASARVVWIGASRRAATIARAMLRARRSSPSVAQMAASSRSDAHPTCPGAGGGGAGGGHAEVGRTGGEEGKAGRRLVELHRRDPEVEDNAVDRLIAAAARDRLQIGEFVLHQDEPAAGVAHEVGATRDR